MASGNMVCGQLRDRIGRKTCLHPISSCALLMVISIPDHRTHTLLWVGAVMGLFVNGRMAPSSADVGSLSTVARATAQNVLWNCSRGGRLGRSQSAL